MDQPPGLSRRTVALAFSAHFTVCSQLCSHFLRGNFGSNIEDILCSIRLRSERNTTVAVRWEHQTPSSSYARNWRLCFESNLPGHRLGHLLPREWPIVGERQIHALNCGLPSLRKRSYWAQGEAGRSQVRCHRAEWSMASRPHPTSCCLSLQQTYFSLSERGTKFTRQSFHWAPRWEVSVRGVNLTTRLNLLPKQSMCKSLVSPPPCLYGVVLN
jgi:hypothetical protein